jgi:GNAT superfamily N-acetyltransferase
MAEVQVAAWRERYADLLPAEVLDTLDAGAIATGWQEALSRPRDARNRALVALDHDLVRGYVVTGPASDPDVDPIADGELSDLTIAPDRTRQGHGSRLLHAAVDTLRADHFQRALVWITATDDALRAFYTDAGWAPDGAHRTLDLTGDGSIQVKQVRLHASITEH